MYVSKSIGITATPKFKAPVASVKPAISSAVSGQGRIISMKDIGVEPLNAKWGDEDFDDFDDLDDE